MTPNSIYNQYLMQVLSRGKEALPVRGQSDGTIAAFGVCDPMVFDLRNGIPVISTKLIRTKAIIEEFKWFLDGNTNAGDLDSKDVKIWNKNAFERYLRLMVPEGLDDIDYKEFLRRMRAKMVVGYKNDKYRYGDLGPMYGYQLRNKKVINDEGEIVVVDQVAATIKRLRMQPRSRQVVIDCYDPYDWTVSALPPCHSMPLLFFPEEMSIGERHLYIPESDATYGFKYTEAELDSMGVPKFYLNMQMIQRSGDSFLGVPFNITSSALMHKFIAESANMVPKTYSLNVANAHIYLSHRSMVAEQLKYETDLNRSYFDCKITSGANFTVKDVELDYSTVAPEIKAGMIV